MQSGEARRAGAGAQGGGPAGPGCRSPRAVAPPRGSTTDDVGSLAPDLGLRSARIDGKSAAKLDIVELSELKQKHRAIWPRRLRPDRQGHQAVSDHLVRVARIRAGEHVARHRCGNGQHGSDGPCARRGGHGPRLTPRAARGRAEGASNEGLEDHLEGRRPEALPFPDGSFDVVVSSCGLMFVPDQQKVAAEVARVPSAEADRIQAWMAREWARRSFKVTPIRPPPPRVTREPLRVGDDCQGEALSIRVRDYRFERYDCPEFADTPEQLADLFIEWYGPTNRAHASLPPEKAAAFRKDLIEVYRGYVTPADGKVRWGREYIITLATRA